MNIITCMHNNNKHRRILLIDHQLCVHLHLDTNTIIGMQEYTTVIYKYISRNTVP